MQRLIALAILSIAACRGTPQGQPPGPIRTQFLPITVDEARAELPVPDSARVLETWAVVDFEASVTACVPGAPEAAAAAVRERLERAGWPAISLFPEQGRVRLAGARYPARLSGTATAGDRPDCGADASVVRLSMRKGHETE